MTVARPAKAELDSKAYLRILRKHRWLIIGSVLVTGFTAAIWTHLQIPIYQATTTVLIEPEAPRVISIMEVAPMGGGTDYYQTQYEIIKSRAVLEKAAEMHQLKSRLPELQGVSDPYPVVLARLAVEPKRNTRLVLLRFEHADPQVAADAANAIAAAYARHNVELKLRGAREAMSWLNEQMSALKKKVEDSGSALQNYRVKAGILGLNEQRQITAAKIMDFNKAYLEAQAQRLTIEVKVRELTEIARDKAGAQTIFTVADTQLIQKLKNEASDLEVQKSKMLKTYKDKHPEILKIDAQIRQVNQRIDVEIQTMLRAIRTEYRVAKAREETLLGNVKQLRREAQELNEKEIEYLTLQRETESNQVLYDAVMRRLKETGIAGGLDTNNVRVLEEATVPSSPVKPRKRFNIALGIVVGLLAGVGIAFVTEFLDTTIKSPDDVERHLGLPVIGIVPTFGGKR